MTEILIGDSYRHTSGINTECQTKLLQFY